MCIIAIKVSKIFFLREAEFQVEARNSREGSAEGCFACLWGKGVIRGGDRKGAPEGGSGEGSGWARREERYRS